jgi:hypothetical protein
MDYKLSIPEKIFLLSVNPEKGGLVNNIGYSLDLSIISAFIMEIKVKGIIEITDNRITIKKQIVGIPLEQFILSKFEKFDRPLTIGRWINRLHFSFRYIKKELKKGLVEKRLIRLEEKQFLFFKWTKPYLLEKRKVNELKGEIENMIYSGEFQEDGKFVLSLLEPAGLMRRLFPERENRQNAHRRIKQYGVENEVSIALKRAINARRAAAAS